MSQKNLKFRFFKNKIKLNIKYILTAFFVGVLLTIIFVLIFVFALKRNWYDGLSVVSMFFIGISFLLIIFNKSEFNYFIKLKNLFIVKKENKEELTKFEKEQINVLNLKFSDKERTNFSKEGKLFLYFTFLIYGIIILIISLPFLFL